MSEQILVIVVQDFNAVVTTESFKPSEVEDAEKCFINELNNHSGTPLLPEDEEIALEQGNYNVLKDRVVTGVNLVWI
jgi:hypothetical protein